MSKRTTYHQFSQTDADNAGGRYAKLHPPTNASSPNPYPPQPPNSPFHHDPVPKEEPLGYSVDAHEPVGTAKEIEASLAEQMAPVANAQVATVETEAQPSPKDNDA